MHGSLSHLLGLKTKWDVSCANEFGFDAEPVKELAGHETLIELQVIIQSFSCLQAMCQKVRKDKTTGEVEEGGSRESKILAAQKSLDASGLRVHESLRKILLEHGVKEQEKGKLPTAAEAANGIQSTTKTRISVSKGGAGAGALGEN